MRNRPTPLPCQFCGADISIEKHKKWCPVINPVTAGEPNEEEVRTWVAVIEDPEEPVHRKAIASMELEHYRRPALKWLDSIKKV